MAATRVFTRLLVMTLVVGIIQGTSTPDPSAGGSGSGSGEQEDQEEQGQGQDQEDRGQDQEHQGQDQEDQEDRGQDQGQDQEEQAQPLLNPEMELKRSSSVGLRILCCPLSSVPFLKIFNKNEL